MCFASARQPGAHGHLVAVEDHRRLRVGQQIVQPCGVLQVSRAGGGDGHPGAVVDERHRDQVRVVHQDQAFGDHCRLGGG